ncbi:uncharacterized protein EV422DRAFT_508753 [Fimicolochytrium jonesii]|uniref:uncharacterized protein n=1 Tax=Fimicolochytrium jonesii TaxID=1396493 RepID=UPI0022FDB7EA|nr:uncharacterized protein EV422DRAFT_508753 [Fimicolochytrium jonesii]KAI8817675.1 hypothetical protein EV422DRAFT_508753 [Fimicolochytrium jonesii]
MTDQTDRGIISDLAGKFTGQPPVPGNNNNNNTTGEKHDDNKGLKIGIVKYFERERVRWGTGAEECLGTVPTIAPERSVGMLEGSGDSEENCGSHTIPMSSSQAECPRRKRSEQGIVPPSAPSQCIRARNSHREPSFSHSHSPLPLSLPSGVGYLAYEQWLAHQKKSHNESTVSEFQKLASTSGSSGDKHKEKGEKNEKNEKNEKKDKKDKDGKEKKHKDGEKKHKKEKKGSGSDSSSSSSDSD